MNNFIAFDGSHKAQLSMNEKCAFIWRHLHIGCCCIIALQMDVLFCSCTPKLGIEYFHFSIPIWYSTPVLLNQVCIEKGSALKCPECKNAGGEKLREFRNAGSRVADEFRECRIEGSLWRREEDT